MVQQGSPFLLLLFLALTTSKCFGFTTPYQTIRLGNGAQHQLTTRKYPETTFSTVLSRDSSSTCTSPASPNTFVTSPPYYSSHSNTPSKQRHLAMLGTTGGLGGDSIHAIVQTLFQYHGNVPFLPSLVLNVVLFTLLRSKLLKMLTPQGFVHGIALGTMLWKTLGWRGWSLTVLYLFLGSAVTKVGFADKEKRGIAESRGGRRGPENLWGSAATGLACAICSKLGSSFLGIPSNLFVLAYVTSMATKLSDTFASEIGKAYGKTTFLITTLERVEPGTEGAISAEGTGAAMVGGFLLALYGWGIGLIPNNPTSVAIVTISAFLATNVESLLGATLQGKDNMKWITNEMINFFNTLIGAGFAIAAGFAFL